MDARRKAALLNRLELHYARFDRDAREIGARSGDPGEKPILKPVQLPVARTLTPRERTVITLIAEGLTDREIGDELEIGAETVKTYVRGILAKLDARNRTHAVVTAVRLGYLELGRSASNREVRRLPRASGS